MRLSPQVEACLLQHIAQDAATATSRRILAHAAVRIPQIQLILLDVLRQGALPEQPHIRLAGETLPVALLACVDFFASLQDAYALHQTPLTWARLRFAGTGADAQVRDLCMALLGSYQDALGRELVGTLAWSDDATDAANSANLILIDTPTPQQLDNTPLEALPDGGLVVMLHDPPESDLEADTSAMMRWRADFMASHPDFRTLGPCGAELGADLPRRCQLCNVPRYADMHFPAYYRHLHLPDDGAPAHDYLKWQYVILQRCKTDPPKPPNVALFYRPQDLQQGQPQTLTVRYMGRYANKTRMLERTHQAGTEYIRLCPAVVEPPAQSFALQRQVGDAFPRLAFGDLFTMQGAAYANKNTASERQLLRISAETRFARDATDSSPEEKAKANANANEAQQTGFISGYDAAVIDRLARRFFGFKAMRPFQHQILRRVLQGRSILGIAATGGGKSECFILPALTLPGVTIVVSPLKSLMQDQVSERLHNRYGLSHVADYVNSDKTFQERQQILRRMQLGHYKLVYFTPEQLERAYVLETLKRVDEAVGIRYIALDEAHCVSHWGHDFRPSYLNITRRLSQYGIHPVRIALTATASPRVRQDICEELELDPRLIQEGGDVLVDTSNRPELNLIVRTFATQNEKSLHMLETLGQFKREYGTDGGEKGGSAIVFMPTTGGSPESLRNYYPLEAFFGGKKPAYEQVQQLIRRIERGDLSETERRRLLMAGQAGLLGGASSGAVPFASYLERKLQHAVAIYHGKMKDEREDSDPDGPALQSQADTDAHIYGVLVGRNRQAEQRAFIRGERNIMVATKGFGMGVDKDNVRLILHRSPTENLEAYAQEAGRAGRDGEFSDVVLYYSPGASELQNGQQGRTDTELLRYFIESRYIREVDAQAMLDFLRTLGPGIRGNVYFTLDQVIAYLDSYKRDGAPYQWPQFERYKSSGRESGEHLHVLSAGLRYEQQCTYLLRVLSVMHRVRPDLPDLGPRQALIERQSTVNIEIRYVQVWDARRIVHSNHYFGHVLRDAGVTPSEFTSLLQYPVRTIVPLAHRLGLSLYETSQLLTDISFSAGSTGSTGKWNSHLLSIWLVTPRPEHLQDDEAWLMYAGAYRYGGYTGQPKLTLLDWFPPKTHNSPIGIEIEPGALFQQPQHDDDYVKAFMAQHDERRKNDWDSYYRMINDYVGVTESGEALEARRNCLRAVLLGYLKSNEVVVGGNCYSCNVCVPDEKFVLGEEGRKLRESAIARMSQDAQNRLEHIESFTNRHPDLETLTQLFELVEAEEAQGRSLRTYVNSWSARLLQDIPTHRGALWVRLWGGLHDKLSIQQADVIRVLDSLTQLPMPKGHAQTLLDLMADARDDAQVLYLRGRLKNRMEAPADGLADWQQALAAKHLNAEVEHDIYLAWMSVATADEIPWLRSQLAWLITSWHASTAAFTPYIRDFTWADLIAYLASAPLPRFAEPLNAAYALWGWLEDRQHDHAALRQVVRRLIDAGHIQQIPASMLREVLLLADFDVLRTDKTLLLDFMDALDARDDADHDVWQMQQMIAMLAFRDALN